MKPTARKGFAGPDVGDRNPVDRGIFHLRMTARARAGTTRHTDER